MDSTDTKATPAPSTKRRSRNSVPANGTAEASAASKNIASAAEVRPGRRAERQAWEALERLGYELLFANHKISKVEIDLVVKNPDGETCLIEVKTLRSGEYFERRVTPGQIRRIRFVLGILLERSVPARAHLICVADQRITLVEDFFVRDL